MLPLKDENPTSSSPVVTMVLIAACVAIYVFVQPRGSQDLAGAEENLRFNYETAAIPCEVVQGRPLGLEEIRGTLSGDDTSCDDGSSGRAPFSGKNVYLAVLYSMFLHGSWLHLGGNMLYLWVFGNNIEDRKGKATYLVFYLLAGVAATLAHIFVQPDSTIPLVGASGAIAGVMGAYLVLYPNVRIKSLIFFGIILFRDIPAKWLLGIWFVSQFFITAGSGVAWVAHVGGFVFGLGAGLLWRATDKPEEPSLTYRGL